MNLIIDLYTVRLYTLLYTGEIHKDVYKWDLHQILTSSLIITINYKKYTYNKVTSDERDDITTHGK